MAKPSIAFFGLGLMGSGMARRLLGAGFPVTVFNRDRTKAAALEREGGKAAGSPCDAVKNAEIVVSMVADDNASRAMWLGEQGALADVARGAVLIEASTLTVDWIKELASAAAAKGCDLLDAPVTGSKSHAAAGELNFLVGGSAAALEKARPVLSAMSKSIVHIGPTGSGALLKLINNFLCAVQVASVAEALTLIERSGLDRDKAIEFLMAGAPGSGVMKTVLPRMVSRNFAPNFKLALMVKDLAYSLKEGEQHGIKLASVESALKAFNEAVAAGKADEDFASVVEPIRNQRLTE
ncbi:MAG TPA: NAD(P)-dependent oxidoreductase [Verrucomicrobiae bacterium]|nr:NAD(P)-dependent oxidoreductase [Verrucomicrobiae bacterium]